jgi:hypothetical protein
LIEASYVHDGKVWTFKTHRELDTYVNALIDTANASGKEIAADHWNLLKSFDRGFWMRHTYTTDPHITKPSQHCPFDHKTKYDIDYQRLP